MSIRDHKVDPKSKKGKKTVAKLYNQNILEKEFG